MSETEKYASVTELLKYKETKRQLENMLASVDLEKLSNDELLKLISQMGNLLTLQSDLFNTMMIDMSMLVEKTSLMQEQFMLVSGQAYLAIQTLKDKGIISPEELEANWNAIRERFFKDPAASVQE